MSLARTALRLATVASLQGATLAQTRVYDSRISDFNPETFLDDAKPTIIVLTDDDEGENLSQQNGGPPFRRMVDLVFEIGIVQTQQADDGTFIVGYPNTDARHEASLDLIEFQIARCLGYDLSAMPIVWRNMSRPRKYNCHRQVVDDAGVKIACRILTWTCEIGDDQIKIYNSGDTVPTGLDATPTGFQKVANALPAGSSGVDIVNAIAAALSPLTAVPLDGIDFTFDTGDSQDASDMFDVSMEIRAAVDMPQIVASTGSATLDYSKGTFQNLILAADLTALTIINWPQNAKTGRLILKVTNTGNFSIAGNAWPAGTEWVGGGIPPAITQGAGSVDLIVLVSGNGGAEIFGNVAGQNYKTPT